MDQPTRDAPAAGYRVLARKYRPSSFADLIGQEPMVRTLTNAFATGRIAQAYMLTGVRGVGKTTTARILARALNYVGPDGEDAGPTLDMAAEGRHCRAILESRHVDVIEMDAASHTGIENIREIIDSVRYHPAEARYKVYIVDEVHMLSKPAFNGLLKTLEEPPEHVKFIFATTEIRKVPITVLSRCQRFDLRRVESESLVRHLESVVAAENVAADAEALRLIARAGEGSVRDALSLLDQAIAHGGGRVDTGQVRGMLGVADRGRIVTLFEQTMSGNAAGALAELELQHAEGAAPETVLADLAGFVHLVTRLRIVPESADDAALSEVERTRGREFASRIAVAELTRAWQILLKGIAEVEASPRPLAAAEMVLIRLAYAASLPSPDEVIRRMSEEAPAAPPGPAPARMSSRGGGSAAVAAPADAGAVPASADPAPRGAPEGLPQPTSFEEVVALAGEKRAAKLRAWLEIYVRVVRFEPGRIELALVEGAPGELVQELGRALGEWTGRRWVVTVSRGEGAPTIREARAAESSALEDEMRAHPTVGAVLGRFPGARIVDVKRLDAAPAGEPLPAPPGDDEEDDSA